MTELPIDENTPRILIVEDEPKLGQLLIDYLRAASYAPTLISHGDQVLPYVRQTPPDLILLDIMLPDEDGLSIVKKLRTRQDTVLVPVIMVTAKTTEIDKVKGLDLGADDYISKPFSLREVIARVKAVLRRTATAETERAPERLVYQSLVIDITKKKVSIDGEEVQLTKKEFEILLLLVQNKGRVFSREDILTRIWSDEVYVLDRTIDVNITRLRKKIGEYGKCIVTRLGYGYCFEAE